MFWQNFAVETVRSKVHLYVSPETKEELVEQLSKCPAHGLSPPVGSATILVWYDEGKRGCQPCLEPQVPGAQTPLPKVRGRQVAGRP